MLGMSSCIANHIDAEDVCLAAWLTTLDCCSEMRRILQLESQLLDELSRRDVGAGLIHEKHKLVVRSISEIDRHKLGLAASER